MTPDLSHSFKLISANNFVSKLQVNRSAILNVGPFALCFLSFMFICVVVAVVVVVVYLF